MISGSKKFTAATLAAALALVPPGCGGSDATTATTATGGTETRSPRPAASPERKPHAFPVISDRDDPRFATVAGGRDGDPRIDPADRPAPRQLLVRDIEVGSGPVARTGDEASVWYFGVDYGTGAKRFEAWPPPPDPFVFELRPYGTAEVWEKGILGMRAGGRREVIVPSRLAFGDGALDYVFVMARVEPASRSNANRSRSG